MAENDAPNATTDDVATQPSEGAVTTATGPVEPGAGLDPAAGVAQGPADMSNTYENGVPASVGQVNTAVPEGAKVITDFDEATEAGYFGYARGADNTESYTLAEAGKRNQRLREARRAVVNRSEEDADGHTADAPKRDRGSRSR